MNTTYEAQATCAVLTFISSVEIPRADLAILANDSTHGARRVLIHLWPGDAFIGAAKGEKG